MSDTMLWIYVLGNVLGRGLLSWGLVWLVCLALTKGQWRRALSWSLRWPAWVLTGVLTVGGMAAGVRHGL